LFGKIYEWGFVKGKIGSGNARDLLLRLLDADCTFYTEENARMVSALNGPHGYALIKVLAIKRGIELHK
jgi:hypothetical protein